MPELAVYNLPLSRLQSRLDSNTFTNLMPKLTLTLCQSQLYPPVKDFGFSLCYKCEVYTLLNEKAPRS
jgi:hypothetical protein